MRKQLRFLGDSLKCLRDFPEDARQDVGYQLDNVQRGEQPDDFKPMPAIGKGVEEILVRDDSRTRHRPRQSTIFRSELRNAK